ncbi:hypothetical protein L1987_84298 [Smallanthus sonchifolius]|uniref:Uncharacterized protein n=1 Tax=Smallanthus sonchifolius TaxID=185202 RepID=A0ACB8YEI0_9ASTR|nr:hypothetical protein L1987_84298 [Smallanthus sonchifolius]
MTNTTTAPNTQLRVGAQSTTKLAKSTRTPSVLEQMVHTTYLDMGSKQHWMAGGGANEKEAPESSSKATSNMNDKLNELLDPYVQSLSKVSLPRVLWRKRKSMLILMTKKK